MNQETPDIKVEKLNSFLLNMKKNRDRYIVSLRDSKKNGTAYKEIDRFCSKDSKGMISSYFDDVWLPEHEKMGYKLPTKEDVAKILEWAKGKSPMTVHCTGGISRSAAMAYLIACLSFPPEEAIKVLNPLIHSPNELIVQFGAEILGNPRILEVCKKFEEGGRNLISGSGEAVLGGGSVFRIG